MGKNCKTGGVFGIKIYPGQNVGVTGRDVRSRNSETEFEVKRRDELHIVSILLVFDSNLCREFFIID